MQLKSGKCKDTAGITAELLKAGGDVIESHLLKLFNDIITPGQEPPEQWRRTTISVIYKSGDPQLPQNYRPIAIIPLLYKLMSRLLCNRLEANFESEQSPDQAGFRKGFCTEDHLFTTTLLYEQSYEWQLPLWAAAIDFKRRLTASTTNTYGTHFDSRTCLTHTFPCCRTSTMTRPPRSRPTSTARNSAYNAGSNKVTHSVPTCSAHFPTSQAFVGT